jgi:hypothetical protein
MLKGRRDELGTRIAHRLRRRIVTVLMCGMVAIALLAGFEAGIRRVPPDSVQFTQTDVNGRVLQRSVMTNPARAQRWYRLILSGAEENSLFDSCNGITPPLAHPNSESYDFMWRGITIAHVEATDSACGSIQSVRYTVTQGGMQDWNLYYGSLPAITPQTAP